MFSIQVQNLRSLKDTGEIDLAPLTLLVGENSSGKSTFIRLFPLLRQSTDTVTGSGLLLRGGYVDYGPFPVALRKGADSNKITFTLGFNLPSKNEGYGGSPSLIEELPIKLRVAFAARRQEASFSYLCGADLYLGDEQQDHISFEANEDGSITKLLVNEYDAAGQLERVALRSGRGVIPLLRTLPKGIDAPSEETEYDAGAFNESLLSATNWIFHGRTTIEVRLAVFDAIRIGTPEGMLAEMQRASAMSKWQSTVRRWNTTNSQFLKLRNLLIANRLSTLLTVAAREMASFSSGLRYFAPLRAPLGRDYPITDLTVDEVAKDGANLPMVLARLSSKDLEDFQVWTEKYFGFTIKVLPLGDGSSVTLRLQDNISGMDVTLADTGFGFSQMLPFILQIWNVTQRDGLFETASSTKRLRGYRPRDRNLGFLIAIEQPELHLHPALQAKVVDMMAAAIHILKGKEIPIHFVLETHSPTFVERIGHLISGKQFSPDDAKVLFFDRITNTDGSTISNVQTALYNNEGVLLDPFPLGFFLTSSEGILFPRTAEFEQLS